LTVRGEIVNFGRQFSVAEAKVFDHEGRLLASGRGTYLTTPPA
jgi:acyl-coenzyme A thioesterase PaaI-like protein